MKIFNSNIFYLVSFWVSIVLLYKGFVWLLTLKWIVLALKYAVLAFMLVLLNVFIYFLIDLSRHDD